MLLTVMECRHGAIMGLCQKIMARDKVVSSIRACIHTCIADWFGSNMIFCGSSSLKRFDTLGLLWSRAGVGHRQGLICRGKPCITILCVNYNIGRVTDTLCSYTATHLAAASSCCRSGQLATFERPSLHR